MLHQATGKPSPDMLILGGQLWDIARWYLTGPHLVNFRVLPLHLLHAWMADLTKALQVIEVSQMACRCLCEKAKVFVRLSSSC